MPPVNDSLWPDTIITKSIPDPVSILKKQGDILESITNGSLYGEVIQSRLLAHDVARYDLYVGTKSKSIRQKLLTVECSILSGYPTRIINHAADDEEVEVHNEDSYKEQLRLIFNAPMTTELVGRLWALALD
jgi:hypothetical protein